VGEQELYGERSRGKEKEIAEGRLRVVPSTGDKESGNFTEKASKKNTKAPRNAT